MFLLPDNEEFHLGKIPVDVEVQYSGQLQKEYVELYL